MKALIGILLGAFAVFMVLAVAQEREVFVSSWLGAPPQAPALSEADRRGASEAVRTALTLMSHIYASGGDPRFVDRIQASEGVVEEILADVHYLARNHRYQEMHLDALETVSVAAVGNGSTEVRTRETWTIRTRWVGGSGESDPPVSFRVGGKYLVARSGTGWKVEAWETLEEDRPPPGPPG